MKREDVRAIFPEATDDQIKAFMDLNGKDVEKAKAKVEALEADLDDKKVAFDNLNSEFEKLKSTNASADDWRARFEALQAENAAKEKQAEADRILKEKQDNVLSRFNGVLGDKKFTHEAIRDSYLRKFGDALESKDYEGKSDADIFHDLTKDDATAFSGITAVKLAGGRPQSVGKNYDSVKEIMNSDMDRAAKRQAIAENIAKGNI